MTAANGQYLPGPGTGRSTFEVAFDLKPEAPNWPPVPVERLWGEKTTVEFEMRLLNVPFFARGVAYGDLVHVRPDQERRELVFERLNGESGHSTLRITVLDQRAGRDVQTRLRAAGCSWETAAQFSALLAVDVPADGDYRALRDWLVARRSEGTIEFQESAISARHLEQVPDFPA
ncbi:hypothetical protein ABIA35_006106 [Catenulispora sp. MAP12-49]|uniref:DUF4265 domain-containing protein n=1 Tax=unclassified Catenulispora TaxID=414885 RepID=UPI003517D1AA